MAGSKYNAHDSPFLELRTPFTDKEAVKLLILLPTVIPRLLIAVAVLSFVALVNTLAAWNWPVDKPLTAKRRAWVLWSKEFLIVVLWMLGFRVKVTGRENIAKAEKLGSVVVFSHSSYVDAIIMMWLLAPAGVGKSGVSNIPIIKYVVRAYQPIFFHEDRKRAAAGSSGNAVAASAAASVAAASATPTNGAGAAAAPAQAAKERKPKKNPVAYIVQGSVTEVLQQRVSDPTYGQPGGFPLVAIAPEGTCGDGRGLLEFRTGAFVPGRPVLPLCIKYGITAHNPAWTQVYSLGWHLIRLMCQWRNELDITILPPYAPSPEEKADPKLYATNVRSLMSKASGLPLQPHNNAHFIALKKLNVVVDWSGTTVLAPPGVVDKDGTIDFAKHGITA